MWHCPVCNNSIDANFGMVQCSKCQTVLFVDFNGNVIIGGGEEPSSDDGKVHENINAQDIELDKSDYAEVVMPEEDVVEEPTSKEQVARHDQPVVTENFWSTATEEQSAQFSVVESQSIEESFSPPTFDEPFQPPEYQNESPAVPSVTRVEGLPRGAVFYQIHIEGIDASSLRIAVLDSLRDSRLGLINDEISGNIDQGQLIIKGLNPVKASFIMNALKDLPLEINWEMYAQENTSDAQE